MFITIVLGVVFLGSTIIGYFKAKSTPVERTLTGIAALCMLVHEHVSSVVGICIMVVIYILQRRRTRQPASVSPVTTG